MSDQFAIVFTTLPDDEAAQNLALTLVEDRLAGCVQLEQIRSIYRWNDGVERDKEVRLTCKVAKADVDAVMARIKAAHSYQTPELVAVDISAGDPAYLSWLNESTRRTS